MCTVGLKPIAQSYSAMIHGFMRTGQTEEAQRMFHSLQDSGHSAYTGWLAITNQLFAAGQQAAARELVARRQPQWLPDADLYEEIIKSVCSSTEVEPFSYMLNTPESAGKLGNGDAQVEEALQILAEMQVWQSQTAALASVLLLFLKFCLCCASMLSAMQLREWPSPQLCWCRSWLRLLFCHILRQRL